MLDALGLEQFGGAAVVGDVDWLFNVMVSYIGLNTRVLPGVFLQIQAFHRLLNCGGSVMDGFDDARIRVN